MILVDTSVWSNHNRRADATLVGLLQMQQVLLHDLVIGELACGTPREPRAAFLAELGRMPQASIATVAEALRLIEQEQLYGRGLGWVDVMLLASTLITPSALLYTLDKRLDAAARQLGIAYGHSSH